MGLSAAISSISAPAEKARPLPDKTMTRTSSFRSKDSAASTISPTIWRFNALYWAGLFNSIKATPSSWETSINSYDFIHRLPRSLRLQAFRQISLNLFQKPFLLRIASLFVNLQGCHNAFHTLNSMEVLYPLVFL